MSILSNPIQFHTVDPDIYFDFFEKSLGLVSPQHFVYDFSRKVFPMLYFIN